MTALAQFTRQNNALAFSQHAMRRTNPVKEFPMGAAAAALNHPWKFEQDGDTGGVLTLGKVYMGGVAKTVTDWPTDGELSSVTTTTEYWIELNFQDGTATFDSGESVPENTAAVEYWHILTLTCADDIISEVFNPWPCDIRALLNP